MATIGQQLLSPEDGWQRIDDTDTSISYKKGYMSKLSDVAGCYNNTCTYGQPGNNVVACTFSFIGTKLRILGYHDPNANWSMGDIIIDGNVVASYYMPGSKNATQILLSDISGLANEVHNVSIVNTGGTNAMVGIDAIDIDDTGRMIAPIRNIGDPLPKPDTGWKRIDDTDVNILYNNYLSKGAIDGSFYNSTYTQGRNMTVKFTISGTSRLRLIGQTYRGGDTSDGYIKIDGVQVSSFAEFSYTTVNGALIAEISGLSLDKHTVDIGCNDFGYVVIDAIDIDSSGVIVPLPFKPQCQTWLCGL